MSSVRRIAAKYLPNSLKREIKWLLGESVDRQRVLERQDLSLTEEKPAIEKLAARTSSGPLVSVVVPVYNVQDYLEECLDSIIAQTYKHLQVIIVDDGSTDNSLDIARNVAKRDRRLKVFTKGNAGLGAARNTGVEHASGAYVVFADSDDVVPPDAYQSMVSSLEKTGSEFATGSLYRFTGNDKSVPVWCQKLHAEDQLATNISQYAAGLVNVYAWNKMYRKSFWDRLAMDYPEGIRYEDQEPSTKMFLLAEKFDVLKQEVYGYRVRDDQSSITQNKHVLKDIEDRISVIRSTSHIIDGYASPEVREAWVEKLIRYDVMPYIRAGLGGDTAYRHRVFELCDLVYRFAANNGFGEAPSKVRSAMSAILSNGWEGLSESILFNDETGAHIPASFERDRLVLDSPIMDLIEQEYSDFGGLLTLDETKVVAVAHEIVAADSEQLIVTGAAFIKTLSVPDLQADSEIRVWAVNRESGVRVPAIVDRCSSPWVTAWSQSKWCDYSGAGFVAKLNVTAMRSALGADYATRRNSTWELFFEVRYAGVVRVGNLDRVVGGSFASVLGRELEFGSRNVTWSTQSDAIEFSINSSDVKLKVQESNDRLLVLEASGPKAGSIKSAKIVRRGKSIAVPTQRVSGTGSVLLAVPTSKLNRDIHESWNLDILGDRSEKLAVTVLERECSAATVTDFDLTVSSRARAQITSNPPVLSVTELFGDGDCLVVKGTANVSLEYIQDSVLFLQSGSHKTHPAVLRWNENRFTAFLKLDHLASEAGRLPFLGYSLRHLSVGRERAVQVQSSTYVGALPQEFVTTNYRVRASVTKFGNCWLNLSAPLKDDESGAFNQKQLQSDFGRRSVVADQRVVVFNAYLGERVTDSGKQIVEDIMDRGLELELYWTVATPAVAVPEGVHKIVQNSKAWYELLSVAGTIFHNIYFDPWFKLREDQRFVQTWHGTPLKTIGHTYWEQIGRSAAWVDRMDQQAESWTHLISPSDYNSEIVIRESGFKGQLLEFGYPRNDILARKEPARILREETRAKLGIVPGDTAVLYAPTWRDSLSAQSWKAAMVNFLDLPSFENQLGDRFVTLVRGHGHNERFGSKVKESERIIDVTTYPEINDLYLAADVIITDYSSVMFDAVVAEKPLIFFVPDLDAYMNNGRGMYTDLRRIAPGPVVFTQHELAEIISDRKTLQEMVTEDSYKHFVAKFAGLDDGNAGNRVIDELWPTE